jgi:hypothetical protein
MGILGKIVGVVKWLVTAPFIALDNILKSIADAGERMRSGVEYLTGVRKKPPTEKIRAALRKQWLELASGEKEIAGVEWEGEIYYDTPK